MNRDHQFTPGTESDRAAYFCDRCGRSREAHGDSTPPATPVEPPEHGWCDVCPVCGGHPHCPDHGDRRASNPPAVSGEGERLKERWDTRDAALRALVEQWRARVDQIVFEDGKHVHERCEGFIDCADQLAALLPTTGDQP